MPPPEMGQRPPTPWLFAGIGVLCAVVGSGIAWAIADDDEAKVAVVIGALFGFAVGAVVGMWATRKWARGDSRPIGGGGKPPILALGGLAAVLVVVGPSRLPPAVMAAGTAWFGGLFIVGMLAARNVPFGRDRKP